MTESAAICQYLATQSRPTSLNVDADEPAFASYLNWLHFSEATLTFPQTLVLRYGRFEPAARRNTQVVDDYARWFLARLRAVDAALVEGGFMCAWRFTAANVSVWDALMLGEYLGLADRFSPAVKGYWGAVAGTDWVPGRVGCAQHAAAEAQGVSPQPALSAGGD